MFQFFDVLCLLCITALVFDIMMYFCKDALKLSKKTVRKNKVRKSNPEVCYSGYAYTDRIAK